MVAQVSSKIGQAYLMMILSLACESPQNKASKDPKPATPNGPVVTQNQSDAPKGFLTDSDLKKPSTVKSLTAQELAEKINKILDFFPPKEVDETISSESDCYSQLWDSSVTNVRKKWAYLEASQDLARCQESGNTSYKKLAQRGFLAFEHTMSDQEITERDGKKFKDLKTKTKSTGKDIFQRETSGITRGFLEIASDVISVSSNVEFQMKNASRESGPSPTYCEKENEVYKNCEKISVSRLTVPSNGQSSTDNYQRILFKNTSGTKGAAHFSSGEIEFEINDWKGVIRFGGDGKAPTWTAQKGSIKTQGNLTKDE